MADKTKTGARQASLSEPMDERDKPDSTDRLVAQAFDSDPQVRLRVAEKLGRTDDPRAIFALIELSSDKDEAVKAAAQRALGTFKENASEGEAIVSLEKLFAERKEAKKPEELPEVQRRMLPTLEKLFAHYEPKKRDSVKRKLMPSIEKLFSFGARQTADPLHGLEKISSHPAEQPAQVPAPKAEEKEKIPLQNAPNFPFGQKKEEAFPQKHDSVEVESEDHLLAADTSEPEFDDDAPSAEEKEHLEQLAHNRLYSLAYTIATTPGMGKAELKHEQNRLLANFKKEIGLAFKMAEEKAKEEGLASFSNLKPGMKNLSFGEMQIVSITDVGYGARKKPFAKLKLTDGHKEISVLMPHERAHGISPADRLSLKGVSVDFLVESNEIVLVVKNKSKVIVVK